MRRQHGEEMSGDGLHGTASQIAALAWEAMREASTLPVDAEGGSAEPDGDWAECLPLMWDAVWQAARGEVPKLAIDPPPDARRMLERARRAFLDLVRSAEPCIDVQEVIRVLVAIEQVEDALDQGALRPPRQEKTPPTGMELLIEVAHDLRSPLTSILFLAETLRGQRGRPLGPPQERQLMLIYSAAFELSTLASDLIELGRNGEQLLEHSAVPFSVDAVLQSVRDIVRPIAEEKGIEVQLAEVPREMRLGHPAALGRVLLNLTTNALRCTEQGRVEIAVQHLSPTRMEFAVVDTGPGVPPEVIESLRGPFDAQAFARTRAFSSAGLGLAICRRLLAAMGSDLRVRAVPGAGSCFHFAIEMPPVEREVARDPGAFDASGEVCDALEERAPPPARAASDRPESAREAHP